MDGLREGFGCWELILAVFCLDGVGFNMVVTLDWLLLVGEAAAQELGVSS